MTTAAKEILHPSGKRRIRIYERSDGNFFFVEEAWHANDFDLASPFSYWADTYRLSPGIYGSVDAALTEIKALPEYRDYENSN